MSKRVEKQAATVAEATAAALEELGLAHDQVTVEVLAGGRRSFFGGARPAHVRVTEKEAADPLGEETPDRVPDPPTTDHPPEHQEDGVADTETTTATDDGAPSTTEAQELTPEERMDRLDQEADLAADFIEGLLDMLDLPGDLEIEVQEEQALINVSEVGSGLLIGRRGATLDALQELVRCATQRQTERRVHVRIDVEGYRARQLEKLRDKCRDAIAQVRETGEPVQLEPMDAYERKMMHDLAARTGGVTSSSEGSEPKRRVVIHPAD